jgi:hypothetical protein
MGQDVYINFVELVEKKNIKSFFKCFFFWEVKNGESFEMFKNVPLFNMDFRNCLVGKSRNRE